MRPTPQDDEDDEMLSTDHSSDENDRHSSGGSSGGSRTSQDSLRSDKSESDDEHETRHQNSKKKKRDKLMILVGVGVILLLIAVAVVAVLLVGSKGQEVGVTASSSGSGRSGDLEGGQVALRPDREDSGGSGSKGEQQTTRNSPATDSTQSKTATAEKEEDSRDVSAQTNTDRKAEPTSPPSKPDDKQKEDKPKDKPKDKPAESNSNDNKPKPKPMKGGKKGVGYNSADFTKQLDIAWGYNWAPQSDLLADGVEFVPMLWDHKADGWQDKARKAIEIGATAILGFNEPDLPEQAHMTVDEAVDSWRKEIEPLGKQFKDVKLISPAVTNGVGTPDKPMGIEWLKQFLEQCTDCRIDAVALHWYDQATNTAYFFKHFEEAHKVLGKPLWITEYMGLGSPEQQGDFLKTVVPWLEQQSFVERHAAFGESSNRARGEPSP
ncbi:hypothetical protein ACM66B_007082 [Microbotryomycetes sp. NB124-2]